MLFSLSVCDKSALIGQLTHAWASTANINRVAVLNKFLCAKLATRHTSRKCITLTCSVMSLSHGIKGGTTDEDFRSSVFCGRAELLLVRNLTFLTFKMFYMHKDIKTQMERKKKTWQVSFKISSFLSEETPCWKISQRHQCCNSRVSVWTPQVYIWLHNRCVKAASESSGSRYKLLQTDGEEV